MTTAKPWREVWSAPGERLVVQARPEDGWTRHRTLSNAEGDGAVAIVTDGQRVLMIQVQRPAIDRTLWELPRGQADAADESANATAARELLEETGRVATETHLIGQIWPDSGLSADAVNVVVVRVDHHAHRAPAEYPEQRWLAIDDVGHEIATGLVADGISIAALALAWSKGVFTRSTDHEDSASRN